METVGNNYLDELKILPSLGTIDSLNVSKKKKKSLNRLNNEIYSSLTSSEKSTSLSHLFLRRYKNHDVNNLIEEIHKFAYKCGFDFGNKEIFLLNPKYRENQPDQPKFIKLEVPYISTHRLIEHLTTSFSDNYTYALRKHSHSKIYVIDIDRRNNNLPEIAYFKKVKEVIQYFGEPFFLEYSEKSEGYHIYYEYNTYIDKGQKSNIEKVVEDKFNIKIELKGTGDFLRLPLSYAYRRFAGTFNPEKYHLIEQKSLLDNLRIFNNHENINIPYYINNISGKSLKAESNKVFDTKFSDNADFSYGSGTRWETQRKIGFFLLHQDINTSFEEFINACEYWNDGTSKDMKAPENKKTKMLSSTWNWCKEQFDSAKKREFQKIDFITDANCYPMLLGADDADDMEMDEKLWKTLRYEVKNAFLRHRPGKRQGAFQKRFEMDCMITMQYLVYLDKWRKEKGYHYKQEEYQFLNGGVPFGVKLQRTLANHYKIKNIKKVFKFLEDSSLIVKHINKEGYSSSYKGIRFTNHYSINSYILNSLYKQNAKTIFNNYIYINNSPSSQPSLGFPPSSEPNSDYIYNIANFSLKELLWRYELGGKTLPERLEKIRITKNRGKPPDFYNWP